MIPNYEVFAIKYAEHSRTANANFIGGDIHDAPMDMDYFIWLIRDGGRMWVVDTGFGKASADERGRRLLRNPADGLRLLGIDPTDVRDVIITHMHYDHVGNLDAFPAACFHLQDSEMQYATGRYMRHQCLCAPYRLADVVGMVKRVYNGQVRYHDGDSVLAPGLSLHLIGGHTRGLQVVRVHTARGWVVLASDASHYYRNIEERRPFPLVFNVGDMVEGWERLEELADSPDHIIPGHDPAVLLRYPTPTAELVNVVAQLHVAPGESPQHGGIIR